MAPLWRFVACLTCLFTIAYGQIGVAPSQTRAFMEELRARHGHGRADVLGEDRAFLEAGRPMLRSYLMRWGTFSQRFPVDNPFGTGQYQVGREYLNPWNEGLPTPTRTGRGIEGLEAAFVFEPMVGLEWNNDADDFSTAVAWLDVNARYALAPNQSLTLQTAAGIGERFTLNVLPGSTLAYDANFGPFAVTVYDTVSTLGGDFDDGFSLWQNALGAAVTWQVNPAWTVTLDYHETLSHEALGFFFTGERTTRSFNAAANVRLSDVWGGGVEAGYSWTDYETNALSENQQTRVGLFAERLFPSKAAVVKLSAGYQHGDFDSMPLMFVGPPFFPLFLNTGDQSNLSAPYFNLIFSQKLSANVSHEVAFGYESNLNTFSNFITTSYANYGVTAGIWRGARVTVSGFLENIDPSGGVFDADGFDFGGSLHLSQQLCPQLTAGFLLHYRRDGSGRFPSAVDSIDGDQYLFGATLDYAITKDWTLKVGLSHRQFGSFYDTNLTTGLRIAF